jgi:carbon storage regulator CsrA
MLVLSRKSNESVVVGASEELSQLLKITVLEIHGNRVTLGFEGDPVIKVNRLEVWARGNGGGLSSQPPSAPAARQPEESPWNDEVATECSSVAPKPGGYFE